VIPSRQQAERIGEATGRPFVVFEYVHRQSGLTCFGIEAEGRIITVPSAAASA
jgi:hypothetical protein